MESRLFLFAPNGPLCFIDYSTIMEGRTIMNKIREMVSIDTPYRGYEFKLFRRIKNKLVTIDTLFLPRFDRSCIEFFIDSVQSRHMPQCGL